MSAGLVGWAFLVARTPTDGYRLMLGPDEPAQRTLIVRHARPGAGAVKPTIDLIRDGTTTLSMASLTLRLTTADLPVPAPSSPSSSPPSSPSSSGTGRSELVLDEHGRPIDVVYGFICRGVIREAADLDLQVARRAALDTYGRVLAGGEAERATPYPLASHLAEASAAPPVTGPRLAGHVAGHVPRPVGALRSPRALAALASVLNVVLATLIGVTVLTGPSMVTVPDAMVGTWTGTYRSAGADRPVTVTIHCGQPCDVRSGDQIGSIRIANCEHRVSVRTVERESLVVQPSTVDGAGCVALGEIRISATDRPDVVTVEWDDGPPLPAPITMTRS